MSNVGRYAIDADYRERNKAAAARYRKTLKHKQARTLNRARPEYKAARAEYERTRYAEDPEYRARVLERNRQWHKRKREEKNAEA